MVSFTHKYPINWPIAAQKVVKSRSGTTILQTKSAITENVLFESVFFKNCDLKTYKNVL